MTVNEFLFDINIFLLYELLNVDSTKPNHAWIIFCSDHYVMCIELVRSTSVDLKIPINEIKSIISFCTDIIQMNDIQEISSYVRERQGNKTIQTVNLMEAFMTTKHC